jgi:hypothetical protein
MPHRVSPTERVRGHIDELFAQDKQLPEILEDVARLGAQLLMQAACSVGLRPSISGKSRSYVTSDLIFPAMSANLDPDDFRRIVPEDVYNFRHDGVFTGLAVRMGVGPQI